MKENMYAYACDEFRSKYNCISNEKEKTIQNIKDKLNSTSFKKLQMGISYKDDILNLLKILDKLLEPHKNF